MAIKIAHESPKSIFREVQARTYYDYALVHLFEEDKEYLDLFKEAKQKGREIILDNSIFELGESFDPDKFAYWIKELKPTWYIVPDVLEDVAGTMASMSRWNLEHANSFTGISKKIGVVQGKTFDELLECYNYMDLYAKVDMIAISFDYSYYTRSCPHPNKHVSWMLGRVKFILDMLPYINRKKPHHLLGVSLPQEGMYYKDLADTRTFNWIHSIDTSNPVVHGIKQISYKDTGLWTKESQKLVDLINMPREEIDFDLINFNIERFNWFWNGQSR